MFWFSVVLNAAMLVVSLATESPWSLVLGFAAFYMVFEGLKKKAGSERAARATQFLVFVGMLTLPFGTSMSTIAAILIFLFCASALHKEQESVQAEG